MSKAYNIMFMSTLMTATLMSISSYSWFGKWPGLEINLLSVIPLMQEQKYFLSNESSIKHFITQAMSSTIILFSIIILMIHSSTYSSSLMKSSIYILMNSSLLTKMGMARSIFDFLK